MGLAHFGEFLNEKLAKSASFQILYGRVTDPPEKGPSLFFHDPITQLDGFMAM